MEVRDSESDEDNNEDEDFGVLVSKVEKEKRVIDKDIVLAKDIDSFWLQREISKYYKEAKESFSIAQKKLMNI